MKSLPDNPPSNKNKKKVTKLLPSLNFFGHAVSVSSCTRVVVCGVLCHQALLCSLYTNNKSYPEFLAESRFSSAYELSNTAGRDVDLRSYPTAFLALICSV